MYHFKKSFRHGCDVCGHPISAHRAEGEVITTPGFIKDYNLFPWDNYSIKNLYATTIDGELWKMISSNFKDGALLRSTASIEALVSEYFDDRLKFSYTFISTHKMTPGDEEARKRAIWTVLPTSILREKYEGAF